LSNTWRSAAFLLPSRNSSSRYWYDWNPDEVPSDPRNSLYSEGVSVARTDHWWVIVSWMCLTRASRLRAVAGSSAAKRSAADLSSWIISFSHSSLVWCWMMNRSSSWCGGSLARCCAPSNSSRCRYDP
jgi:hypothetical protein